jgi:hypothetical protein
MASGGDDDQKREVAKVAKMLLGFHFASQVIGDVTRHAGGEFHGPAVVQQAPSRRTTPENYDGFGHPWPLGLRPLSACA